MATRFDMTIEAGAHTMIPVILKNEDGTAIDITDCSVRMQVRKSVADRTVLDELSTANGRITVDSEGGQFTLHWSDEESCAIRGVFGFYDIFLCSCEQRMSRILEGTFRCRAQITR